MTKESWYWYHKLKKFANSPYDWDDRVMENETEYNKYLHTVSDEEFYELMEKLGFDKV